MPRLNPAVYLALAFLPASPAAADAECESAARAAMLDVRHKVAMTQHTETVMGEFVLKSTAITTPDNRGLVLDENDVPVSLWIGRKFYTSADGGKTWSLLSETSEAAEAAYFDALRRQAENATAITCAPGIAFEGRTVDHYTLDYALASTGAAMRGEYWVDTVTRFPWRIVTTSSVNTIIQNNEPNPDAVIPDPDGG
ncbi:MAG: hypothetical protein WAT70_13410 [Rhizobiaceae bacterium]